MCCMGVVALTFEAAVQQRVLQVSASLPHRPFTLGTTNLKSDAGEKCVNQRPLSVLLRTRTQNTEHRRRTRLAVF